MANFTLTSTRFPNGTSVAAYPASNWAAHKLPPSGAPVGSATDTDTVANGAVTFDGLTHGATYYAYASVSSQHRYVKFTVEADAEDSAWTAPTLTNSWANVGSGVEVAGYRKDDEGRVFLKGSVSGGASGSTGFTLPTGYRPSLSLIFPIPSGNAVINNAGAVVLNVTGTCSLDGIVFYAA